MKVFVAITDSEWYEHLRARPQLDEANFWQPSGGRQFRAINVGEPVLFKLHSPRNYVVGGGFLANFEVLPYRMAWAFFGEANGAPHVVEMRRRIAKYRRVDDDPRADFDIGCIMLAGTFFFDEEEWIPVPADWAPNIVQGKTYDTAEVLGRRLWDDVSTRLLGRHVGESTAAARQGELYGDPVLTRPRLGQGSFRALVSSAYEWRCAVTQEKAHPVLEAAHILPVSEGGRHELPNGLLLRSDVHRLFDNGYVTITPDYTIRVSSRLKDEFDNGEPYYPYDKQRIWVPPGSQNRPSPAFLEWHSDEVFRP